MIKQLKFGILTGASLLMCFFAQNAFATGPVELWSQRGGEYYSDLSSGAATYQVPIDIPPGRNGVQPNLGLNYSSLNSSADTLFGYGWDMPISRIVRRPVTSIKDMYNNGAFALENNGQFIELIDLTLTSGEYGIYGAEVEGSFFLITFNTDNSWTVESKDGVVMTFGASTDSRIDNPSDATQIYAWYIDESRDLNDNYVSYSYFKDGAVLYPSTINYTGNGTIDGPFTIRFESTVRSDIQITYDAGFALEYQYLIESIEVDVESLPVKTYDFVYGIGDNGYRSLLESVTISGIDSEGDTIELEPYEFTYTEATDSWTRDDGTTFVMPYENFAIDQIGLGDFTGDGVADILHLSGSSGSYTKRMWQGSEDGFVDISSDWTLPDYTFASSSSIIADLNNDGFADFGRSYSGGTAYSIYINSGENSFNNVSSSWVVPTTFGFNQSQIRFGDVNGDGLLDIVYLTGCSATSCSTVEVWEGDGVSGWYDMSSEYSLPVLDFGSTGSQMGDLNNDGLADMYRFSATGSSYEKVVYLNQGNGTWLDVSSNWELPDVSLVSSTTGTSFDVNGDGFTDLYKGESSGSAQVWLGNGQGWEEDTSFTGFAGAPTVIGLRFGDFNGDGLQGGMFSLCSSGCSGYVYEHDGEKPDILESVTNPQGAITTISYLPTTQFQSESGDQANPLSPSVFPVVQTLTQDDGLGNTFTTSFGYEDGAFVSTDVYDARIAGFGRTTETYDDGSTKITYYHQGGGYDGETLGEFEDDYKKIGRVYREEIYDSSDNLLKTTIWTWVNEDLGNGQSFIYLKSELELLYDIDGGHDDRATEYTYDTSTGAPLTKIEYGEVLGGDDGSYTDSGVDDRTTSYVYAVNTLGNATGFPSIITLTNNDGVMVSETRYYYDDLALGFVEIGNVTQEEVWISGSDYSSSSYSYNTYGNLLTQTDSLGNVTTNTYDSDNLYPVAVTNALSQIQTYEYDLAFGNPTEVIGVNGVITQMDYDGLGRQVEERRSSTSDASVLETTQTWVYDDVSIPNSVTHRSYLSDLIYTEDITYLDGLGRVIEIKTLNEDADGYIESETIYDQFNRISLTTLPEISLSSAYDASTVSSNLSESYSYDALGRAISTINILGTTETEYDGFTKTIIDSLGNQKDYQTDSLGRLVAVVEYIDGYTSTTSYTWDVADRLVSITDALGNVRNFTYNGQGLRLTAEDLHSPTDTTYGIWTYTYDDVGNLITSLSPNGVTVTNSYDELNRQTSEDASDGSGVEVSYSYDSCINGTGQLCSAIVNGGASTSYIYDEAGNIASETKIIDGFSYTTSFSFDRQGNVLTSAEPDGTTVTQTYNALGKIETIGGVISNTDYGPHGSVITQTNENGTVTTYTYNENARYRLENKSTTGYEDGDSTTSETTTTTTFFANSSDGLIYKFADNWDMAHDSVAGGVNSTGTTASVRVGKTASGYSINRAFLAFDTSSIPDDAVITDASLNLYVSAITDSDDDGDDWITVVESSQTSSTALVAVDFDSAGSVDSPIEGIDNSERKDLSSISTDAYLSISLNSTGQSWISLEDYTTLALREGHDVLDDPLTSATGTANSITFRASEYADTDFDPYLSVTYVQTTITEPEPTAVTLQDLSYTYDTVGNIVQITDLSDTDTAKIATYVYDDLYRLVSATVSGAVDGNDGTITYTYDAIGNIISRSDIGTYSYNGTDYANPHATTSILKIDGTTDLYEYNNNGNLVNDGIKEYSWDYKNRLVSSSEASETTTTTTFFANSSDGLIYKFADNWDMAHDSVAGGVNSTGTTASVRVGKTASGYSINRAFLAFDTSSIPDDAVITDASLNLYVSAITDSDDDGDDWITIVQSSQASPTSLVPVDFDNAGSVDSPVEGIDNSERKDLSSISTDAYLSISLNSTGQSWISLEDYTTLALREGHDVLDDPLTSATGTANSITFRASEYADTQFDPYLTVTYIQPGAPTTTTYTYDHGMGRVSKISDSGTTHYPSSNYSITDGTSTTYISSSAGLTASIENNGLTSVTETIHTDHLGSTSVVTDQDGTMIELLDYNPFGTERSSWSSTSPDGEAESQKTYIGEYSDKESGLSYLNARYYNPPTGQFLSQDPWEGDYTDPQSLNKYAYSRNNPINLYDPGGKMFGFIGRKYIARQVVKYAFSNPIGAAHSATSMIPYVGDAMDVGEVVSGKNAFTGEQLSTGERVVTGVAALLPIVGGAVVRNVGGEVVKAASNAVQVGDNLGALGKVVENSSQIITGFTRHGLNQKITRSVSSSDILDVVRNPSVTIQQAGNTVLRLTQEAAVVLNKGGEVVTTYGKEQFNPIISNIVNNIK